MQIAVLLGVLAVRLMWQHSSLFYSIQFNIYFDQLLSKKKKENCLVHTIYVLKRQTTCKVLNNKNYTNIKHNFVTY